MDVLSVHYLGQQGAYARLDVMDAPLQDPHALRTLERVVTGTISGPGENERPTSCLAKRAAETLLTKVGIPPDALDAIVVATATPTIGFPNEASLLQRDLDARNVAYAVDVNGYPDNIFAGIHTGLTSPSFNGPAYKLVVIVDSILKWRELSQGDEPPPYLGGAIAILLHNATGERYPGGLPALPYVATGHYLPGNPITNERLVRLVPKLKEHDADDNVVKEIDNSSEWIRTMTGAENRYWARDDEDCVDMADPVLDMLEARIRKRTPSFSRTDLGVIVVSTVTGSQDVFRPSTKGKSVVPVSRRIAMRHGIDAYTIDVSLACAGWVAANYVANTAPVDEQHAGRYRATIGVEQLERMEDFRRDGLEAVADHDNDKNLTLFGSAAAGIVQGQAMRGHPELGLREFYSGSDPFDGNTELIYKNPRGLLRMPNGDKVLKQATKKMIEAAHEVMRMAGWTKEMVTKLIPHQANIRIIELIKRRDDLSDDVLVQRIQEFDNVSNVTVPLSMSLEEEEGKLKYTLDGEEGSRVVDPTFGGSLVWASSAKKF